jgi:hypothetical protein
MMTPPTLQPATPAQQVRSRGRRPLQEPRVLTPSKLRAWVKYHATKGAYCPNCGEKFPTDEQWAWKLCSGRRVYLVCSSCALGCSNVVPPSQVPEFLAAHQWEANGYGLVTV